MNKIFTLFWSVFDEDKLKNDIADLKRQQEQEGFWQDLPLVQKVGKHLRILESKLEQINKLDLKIKDLFVLLDFISESPDEEAKEMFVEFQTEFESLKQELDKLRIETMLSGKYDENNAILTIHSGAGGTEAQDWASMLFRMYSMYAEKQGFKLSILNVLDGDEAGIKSITFSVNGINAYGYLKCEKGVHRLVRISPFDANARRHTSFASVEVMPEIEETDEIEIRAEDLKVDTYRSSGAGGQHVNKTESAIRITHIPTGIVVACQTERSQIQNRETCMKMLRSKLAEKKEAEEMEKLSSIRGELKKIEWGSQIRSYVFHPYTMVKDHRTNFETSDVFGVMNGNIQPFITDFLIKSNKKSKE